MKHIIFVLLLTHVLSDNSGINIGVAVSALKLLPKIDLNTFLKDALLLETYSEEGRYTFNYKINLENLTFSEIKSPSSVNVEQQKLEENYGFKLTMEGVSCVLNAENIYINYGSIDEDYQNLKANLAFDTLTGELYFKATGDAVIKISEIKLKSIDISCKDEQKESLNSLFKYIFEENFKKMVNNIVEKGQNAIHKWVTEETVINLGNVIAINITNTLKPQFAELNTHSNFYLNLPKKINNILNHKTFNTELLFKTGFHASLLPYKKPEKLDFDPSVPMEFDMSFIKNEFHFLLSDYSINTLLYMIKDSGFIHKEYTNTSHDIFPDINFDTNGLSKLVPEFKIKYPNNNYKVELQLAINVLENKQPVVKSTKDGLVFSVEFGLKFLTSTSDDPFDDPVLDLHLVIGGEWKIVYEVNGEYLTVKFGDFNVVKYDEKVNLLNVKEDDFKSLVSKVWKEKITDVIKDFTTDLPVCSLLYLATGISFKNFKMENRDGFTYFSIALGE